MKIVWNSDLLLICHHGANVGKCYGHAQWSSLVSSRVVAPATYWRGWCADRAQWRQGMKAFTLASYNTNIYIYVLMGLISEAAALNCLIVTSYHFCFRIYSNIYMFNWAPVLGRWNMAIWYVGSCKRIQQFQCLFTLLNILHMLGKVWRVFLVSGRIGHLRYPWSWRWESHCVYWSRLLWQRIWSSSRYTWSMSHSNINHTLQTEMWNETPVSFVVCLQKMPEEGELQFIMESRHKQEQWLEAVNQSLHEKILDHHNDFGVYTVL